MRLNQSTGSNTCLSLVGIHTAMEAPAPLAVKQWYSIFTRGGAIARPLAILSALATGYVAYNRALLGDSTCRT